MQPDYNRMIRINESKLQLGFVDIRDVWESRGSIGLGLRDRDSFNFRGEYEYGDRILLTFNFAKGTCTAFYNDKKMWNSDSLPNKLWLAASSQKNVKMFCSKLHKVPQL